LPYGAEVAKSRTKQAQARLKYHSVLSHEREIPAWVDYALRKAVHPDPFRRYRELSELTYDLRHPSRMFLRQARPPLLERDPAKFWKAVSAILAVIIIVLLRKLATS
jgi:ribosomal protein L39E